MDNRVIDVTSMGQSGLGLALQLAWMQASGLAATHYKVVKLLETPVYTGDPVDGHFISKVEDSEDGTTTLLLFCREEAGALPLPYAMSLEDTIPFVNGWLGKAERPARPQHDGESEPAWRVFTEAWGQLVGYHHAFVAIQPTWALFGR